MQIIQSKNTKFITYDKVAFVQGIVKNKPWPILWITSDLSIASVITETSIDPSVVTISGTNNDRFEQTLIDIANDSYRVVVLGIEQLLNIPKLQRILDVMAHTRTVVVDHAHQLSLANFDHRPELHHLSFIDQALPDAEWLLFSEALSASEIPLIQQQVDVDIQTPLFRQSTSHQAIMVDDLVHTLQTVIDLVSNQRAIMITHDYQLAEMINNMLDHVFPCGVIHRKVDERKKVETLTKWLSKSLDHVVTTSDTILSNHPSESVAMIVWIERPISIQQMDHWTIKFGSKKTIVLIRSEDRPGQHMIHQFPYDHRLSLIHDVLSNHPNGLTMREIERHLNMESYALEKALKGLRVLNGVIKDKLTYKANPQWSIKQDDIQYIRTLKQEAYDQATAEFKTLLKQDHKVIISDTITQLATNTPMSVKAKVLFPITFYPKSLIDKHLQTETGYVYPMMIPDINTRADSICSLIENNADISHVTIVPLSIKNDVIDTLSDHIANKLFIPKRYLIDDFVSDDLKEALNPYHKMKRIKERLTLIHDQPVSDTIVIIADHGDHFWQMAVAGYELLSRSMCLKVIVIFNQP